MPCLGSDLTFVVFLAVTAVLRQWVWATDPTRRHIKSVTDF